jgi:hypothetical protein
VQMIFDFCIMCGNGKGIVRKMHKNRVRSVYMRLHKQRMIYHTHGITRITDKDVCISVVVP